MKTLKAKDPATIEAARIALKNAYDSRNDGLMTLPNKSTSTEKETIVRKSILTRLNGSEGRPQTSRNQQKDVLISTKKKVRSSIG